MNAKELALTHVAQGSGYSWDLTVLLSFGVSIPLNLRQKVLTGTTSPADADFIRSILKRVPSNPTIH